MNPSKIKAVSGRKRGRPRKNSDAAKETTENKMKNKVFELELLREMILDYVIHDQDKKQAINNVRSCRLVSKVWLRSVSRILLQCQEPLFRLNVRQSVQCQLKYPTEFLTYLASISHPSSDNQQFEQFVKSLCGEHRLDERVPPYAVSLFFEHLPKKKYQSFYNCLAKYGSGLAQLKLQLTAFASKKWSPSPIKHELPKLGFLGVCLNTSDNSEPILTASSNNKRIAYIQAVLKATRQLKAFWMSQYAGDYHLTQAFSTLNLPPTLTHIKLNCVLKDDDLQVLVTNPLPKLTKLELAVTNPPFKEGLITSVLENVRKTLKEFCIGKKGLGGTRKGPTSFKFPLMEKLQTLHFEVRYLEMEQDCSHLESQLPKMHNLSLCPQRYYRFNKWAIRSRFSSVTSLTAKMTTTHDECDSDLEEEDQQDESDDEHREDEEEEEADQGQKGEDSMSTMQILCNAFPNIQQLDLTWGLANVSGFAVIWKELTKLKKLAIHLVNLYEDNCNEFDALLIGIPIESVENVKNSPESWEDLEVQNGASIRNLTELHTLELSNRDMMYQNLISDLAFNFGFLKMPNLKNLIIYAGICNDAKIIQRWCDEGRQVSYALIKGW